MKDAIDSTAGLGNRGSIIDICLDEIHGLQADKILLLAGGEVVDSADSFAARKQFGGDRPANKSGSAGNQISVHFNLSHSSRVHRF